MTYQLQNKKPVVYLNLDEAAERVRMSRHQVQRWIRDGLPVYDSQGRTVVREDQLLHHWRLQMLKRTKWGRHADAKMLDTMS